MRQSFIQVYLGLIALFKILKYEWHIFDSLMQKCFQLVFAQYEENVKSVFTQFFIAYKYIHFRGAL